MAEARRMKVPLPAAPSPVEASSAVGRMAADWLEAATMGLEASAVVGLRLMKVASVNPFSNPVGASLAALECNRMVSEKALTSLQVLARLGLADPLEPMRAQVSANRRRLSR